MSFKNGFRLRPFISVLTGFSFLHAALIDIECTANQRIREIADQNNSHPSQIRQTLESLTN